MAKTKKTIWAVVADEAIARLLERPDNGGELQPVEELTDPAAHAKNAELRDDAHGRRDGGQPATPGGGPQNQPGTVTTSAGDSQQHLEAERFAKRVADRLGERLRERRYDELRIAAAPRFLGNLRKALPAQVTAVVTRELDKDLIHESNAQLTARFFDDER